MIPLVVSALLPLAPKLINWVERLITKNKGGGDRMAMLTNIARTIAARLIETPDSGLTAADLPNDKEIQSFFEPIFQQMKAGGTLGASVVAPSGKLYLVRGVVLEVPQVP